MSTMSVTKLATMNVEITTTHEREICKDIHCDFEATCELGPDKFPRCSCKFDCASIPPENMISVCGSDLKIYSSICAMKMEACQRQQELRLRPLDLCQGSITTTNSSIIFFSSFLSWFWFFIYHK